MDLNTIQDMWERDSKIDDVLLDRASLKIPQLHQKYLTLLNEFKLLQKKKYFELKRLQHKKTLYYAGKLPPDEYADKPFNHKVMKGDVPGWVAVDEDVQRVELQYEYYQTIIDTLQEILRQVHQLSYNIKNAITWRTFTGGV